MTTKYFKNIKNQAELRKAFIKLLKQYHPDNGGDAEICKMINAEYEQLMRDLPKTGGEKQSEADRKAAESFDKEIREALEKIISFDGINIEVVGTWIWVDGATYIYRDQLKALGYRWSKSRHKWHFTPYAEPMFYKGTKKSFDRLRAIYGSATVNSGSEFLLA